MGSGHSHTHAVEGNERALSVALALTATVLVAELVGGLLTGSLALISDAAHMFTDAAALAIALLATRLGRRAPDARRTFGYHRFEIIAAAFNAQLLMMAAAYILYEAWQRLNHPPDIDATTMMAIAFVGLLANAASLRILHAGKDANLNVKGAYLEVWSDTLGSLGVIAGALAIRFTGLAWIDTVVAVAIGVWVVPRTWLLLRESLNILLEGVPEGLRIDDVDRAMRATPGVADIHALHVWALSSGRTCVAAHVVYAAGFSPEQQVIPGLQRMLAARFGVRHTTLQCEDRDCRRVAGAASGDHDHDHDHGHGHGHDCGPVGGPGQHPGGGGNVAGSLR
jgi:cobalt-zinc-cadmium efflux system protein